MTDTQPKPLVSQRTELKPCPFCGKPPRTCPDNSYGAATVFCPDENECQVQPVADADLDIGETLDDAIERWNARPAETLASLSSKGEEYRHAAQARSHHRKPTSMTQPKHLVSQRASQFRDCRQQWQKDQGAKCSCKGTDDMCPCQNFEKHYRGWSIDYVNPPIPIRNFDWSATYPDYDGAEDANDNRHVYARTRELVQAEVDAWIEENSDA